MHASTRGAYQVPTQGPNHTRLGLLTLIRLPSPASVIVITRLGEGRKPGDVCGPRLRPHQHRWMAEAVISQVDSRDNVAPPFKVALSEVAPG